MTGTIGLLFVINTVLIGKVEDIKLYVATNGNDSWSGKIASPITVRFAHQRLRLMAGTDGPFATLERARDEIRNLKSDGLDAPVTVFVRDGIYQLSETLKLDKQDSGSEEAPIKYCAYQGEKPIIIGGKKINGFSSYEDGILKADVGSQGFKGIYFRQLFCNGKRMHLARYPNYDSDNPYGGGWAYADGEHVPMYAEIPNENKHTFQYKEQDTRQWSRLQEGEVFVFPRYNWWNNIVKIRSIDRETRVVTLENDCSYPIRPTDRYYFRNLFEELDAPGEWYLDKETWTLYFYPPDDVDAENMTVYAPTMRTILELGDGVSNITFQGFVFECCDGTAITLNNTTNCIIAGNVIRNVGDYTGSGVAVNGGSDNGVVSNDIYEIGCHGVSLNGGDRITLTPANNCADNNYIHHVGVFYKQGVGIAMSGCGIIASHNLIHDGPRMGIMFSGNNLLIEYNHIRHVNLETADTGAIYTGGRDWISSRGTIIRYNYFHHILGYGQENGKWVSPHYAWGIYLDDNAGGMDVIGNIITNCIRGLIHLHNGRDNLIENNIFIDGKLQQIEYNGWTDKHPYWQNHIDTMIKGYESVKDQPAWKDMRNMDIHPKDAVSPEGMIMSGNVVRKNIVYYSEPDAKLLQLRTVPFDRNKFDENLYWHKGMSLRIPLKDVPEDKEWEEWQKMGQDGKSIVADPLFVDAENGDYRLKSESPAFRLGFEKIPVDEIGPYKDELRASWPIVEAEGAREKPLVSE